MVDDPWALAWMRMRVFAPSSEIVQVTVAESLKSRIGSVPIRTLLSCTEMFVPPPATTLTQVPGAPATVQTQNAPLWSTTKSPTLK